MIEFFKQLNESFKKTKEELRKAEKKNRVFEALASVPSLVRIRFHWHSFLEREYTGYLLGAKVNEKGTRLYLVACECPYDEKDPYAPTGWVEEKDIIEVL